MISACNKTTESTPPERHTATRCPGFTFFPAVALIAPEMPGKAGSVFGNFLELAIPHQALVAALDELLAGQSLQLTERILQAFF